MKFNIGLEVLGTNECPDGGIYYGVFWESALQHIELPSTLKRIEYCVFRDCKDLREIKLPDSIEYVGKGCFLESGLVRIQIPRTGVQADKSSFRKCPAESSLVFRYGRAFPKSE